MAVSTIASSQIVNRDASPRVLNSARVAKGSVLSTVGTLETLSADSIASKYKLVSIPSNARISQVLMSCDAMTAGAADFGIYQTTDNGGAVVDADFFAAAQSLAAALKNSDITYAANGANQSNDISFCERPLWQALGMTTDPKRDFDIVATVTTAVTAAGTLSLEVKYQL